MSICAGCAGELENSRDYIFTKAKIPMNLFLELKQSSYAARGAAPAAPRVSRHGYSRAA